VLLIQKKIRNVHYGIIVFVVVCAPFLFLSCGSGSSDDGVADSHSIMIYTSPEVQDNSDGSISCIISAQVQDRYGNPVPDDTAVYFGVVDHVLNAGNSGQTNGTNIFTAANENFLASGLQQGDTLVILEGRDEGGHRIEAPGNTDLVLSDGLMGSEENIQFVAGTTVFGSICGVVLTGHQEPDATCTPAGGTIIKGIAHTRLTYPRGCHLENLLCIC
jgi:hypothetical protein